MSQPSGIPIARIVREQSGGDSFYIIARQSSEPHALHFGCNIKKSVAREQPAAKWWAEHGNDDMANAEAERWAIGQAQELAQAAFAAHRAEQ